MGSAILTERQKQFLTEFGKQPALTDRFVLTGRTALAGFYYFHRWSEDLDFFSTQEVDPLAVSAWLHTMKKVLRFDIFTSQQSFNRNLFFLAFPDGAQLKTEFTYFPFPHIEKPLAVKGIRIDSKIDIAVNKIFTIYQNPRSRDFIDLYLLMTREGYSLDTLMKHARVKFDFYIDPLQLGAQLIRFPKLADLPRVHIPLNEADVHAYFVTRAKELRGKLFD